MDEVAIVYGWCLRLCGDAPTAETITVEVLGKVGTCAEPPWLRRRNPITRLRYLTIRTVLDGRRSG